MTATEKSLQAGEMIVFSARTSLSPVISALVASAVMLVFPVVCVLYLGFGAIAIISCLLELLLLICFFFRLAYFTSTRISVTDRRVVKCSGNISTVVTDLPRSKITGITISQGLFAKLMNYGMIIIETSANASAIRAEYVVDPFRLKKEMAFPEETHV